MGEIPTHCPFKKVQRASISGNAFSVKYYRLGCCWRNATGTPILKPFTKN